LLHIRSAHLPVPALNLVARTVPHARTFSTAC
jgi:hypothetical protein